MSPLSINNPIGRWQPYRQLKAGLLGYPLIGRIYDLLANPINDVIYDQTDFENNLNLYSGRAVSLNGTTDYGLIPAYSWTGTRKTSFKIKTTTTAQGILIMARDRLPPYTGWDIRVSATGILQVWDGITLRSGTKKVNTGLWVDVAMEISGTNVTLTVNGESETIACSVVSNYTAMDFCIGANEVGATSFFSGEMCDLKLYDGDTLVRYYPMIEHAAGSIDGLPFFDASGNGQHGTWTGCDSVTQEGIPAPYRDIVGYDDRMWFTDTGDYVDLDLPVVLSGDWEISWMGFHPTLGDRIFQGTTAFLSNGTTNVQLKTDQGNFRTIFALINLYGLYTLRKTGSSLALSRNGSSLGSTSIASTDTVTFSRLGGINAVNLAPTGLLADINFNDQFVWDGNPNTAATSGCTVKGSPLTIGDYRRTIPQTALMDWNKFGEGTPVNTLENLPSGAAAIYSLRSGITSNVVRVRRSGDDATADFTGVEVNDGTLEAWVTAGGGTEDGFVVTWYDQSGNARNATQATAGNQPQIGGSGALVTHPDGSGTAAIRFLDTDTGAVGPHLISPAWYGVSQNPVFAHFVYSMGAAGNFPIIFDAHNGTTLNRGYLYAHEGTSMKPRPSSIRTSGYLYAQGTAISLNTRYIGSYAARRTTNGVQAWINGTLNVQGNDRDEDFLSHDSVWIGNASMELLQNDIYLSELVTYGADNRTKVEHDIASYYGLTLPDYLISASTASPTQDALGNPISSPRGRKLNFIGGEAYGEISDDPSLDVTTGFTLFLVGNFWDDGASALRYWERWDVASDNRSIVFYRSSFDSAAAGKVRVLATTLGTAASLYGVSTILQNQTSVIAIRFEASTQPDIFENGTSLTVTMEIGTPPASIFTTDIPIKIPGSFNTDSEIPETQMAAPVYYNRALTDAEILKVTRTLSRQFGV